MSRQLLFTLLGVFAIIQLVFAQEPEGNIQFFTLVVYLFIRMQHEILFFFYQDLSTWIVGYPLMSLLILIDLWD